MRVPALSLRQVFLLGLALLIAPVLALHLLLPKGGGGVRAHGGAAHRSLAVTVCTGARCVEDVERSQAWSKHVADAERAALAAAEGRPPAPPVAPPPPEEPRFLATLRREAEALVREATQLALEQGIPTDVDAALDEELERAAAAGARNDWVDEVAEAAGSGAAAPACAAAADCAPFGVCSSGACRCVAAFHGKRCGHGVLLSWPFLPSFMKAAHLPFLDDLLLLRGSAPFKNAAPAGPGAGERPPDIDAALLARVGAALPRDDTVLRGRVYDSCAVVGASAALLRGAPGAGAAIDAAAAVFRADDAPVAGFEARVGARTTVRVAGLQAWGFRDAAAPGGEADAAVVARVAAPEALRGLEWEAERRRRDAALRPVLALHPALEAHAAAALGFSPSSPLAAALLALHACREVTLFGFLPWGGSEGLLLGSSNGSAAGAGGAYYDACVAPGEWAGREAQLVLALARARVVALGGEPCWEECLRGGPGCEGCRRGRGVDGGAPPACDAAAAAARRAPRAAPWLAAAGG